MVKFNEDQNNTTTSKLKGRFIIDSEINTSSSAINSASVSESTPATASTQNAEIKKGRFSLLESISTESRSNTEIVEGGMIEIL